ncbi:dienelactone hydrolase family protein [Pseudolysinimonas sp.]|uniref:dienelactone hydrolase family protein n=1 Tax=Pseudolysinimonas sp. TaxID=2680009 RepID=UPI003F7D8072
MGTMVDIEGVAAYRAEPVAPPKGGLILIEEIWGLVPHITAVADRFAGEGYVVLAPELLGDIIGSANGQELMEARNDPDEERRNAVQPVLRGLFSAMGDPEFAAGAVAKLVKVVDALETEPGVDGRIGVLGFCFGGTYSFALAAADPRVRAAVPFYGSAPSAEDIARIQAPVLALYGQHDERLIEALPGVERAFADAGVDFPDHVYPDSGHAFFNDTNPHSYNAADADDAWRRATAFLAEHLR